MITLYTILLLPFFECAKLRKKTLITIQVSEKSKEKSGKIDMNHEKRLPKKPSKAFEYIGTTYVYVVKQEFIL